LTRAYTRFVIEVRGLTKSYGATTVVDNLTFSVRDGAVTGFLGPNGAGKSTTMRCMMGLDRPSAGETTFDGVPYASLDRPLTHVGSLLDAKYTNPSRTARNHLRYLAASNGISDARVGEVLDMVGLSTVADKRSGTFSLGMHQRLGIAAALLGNPKTFLFDEPVNGLDPEGILWVRTFMRYLAGEGRTVLVSSHLLSEMANTADDLVVIGQGRLISSGTVADFVAGNVAAWVAVTTPQPRELADELLRIGARVAADGPMSMRVTGATTIQVGEAAARCGVVLHELVDRQASLEEAYLNATAGAVDFRGVTPPGPATGLPPSSVPLPPSPSSSLPAPGAPS
jgi:ABC-2 type transport system ATP-binding protein